MNSKGSSFILIALLLLSFSRTIEAGMGCIFCGPSSFAPPGAGIMPFSQGTPWWTPYGAMTYSNFFFPGPFGSWGLNPTYYPGSGWGQMGGGAVLGKPNVYVHAKTGSEVKIQVNFPKESNLLAAVPIHGNTGWKMKVKGPFHLDVEGTKFSNLFYDFRFDPSSFQEEAGFCTQPENLIPRLMTVLKQLGFQGYELKDFEEHWKVKIPTADEYCVYPQDHRQLDRIAALRIQPTPAKVTRVAFMILPRFNSPVTSKAKSKPKMFARKPKKNWKHVPQKQRTPAHSAQIEVREWGVGFLTQE